MKATYTITTKQHGTYTIERKTRIPGVEVEADTDDLARASAVLVLQALYKQEGAGMMFALDEVDKVESFIDAASGKDTGNRVIFISPEMVAREKAENERRYAEYKVGHETDRLLDAFAGTVNGLRMMAERIDQMRNHLVAQAELPASKHGWEKARINEAHVAQQAAYRAVQELTVYLPQHLDIEDIVRHAGDLADAITERDDLRRKDEAR